MTTPNWRDRLRDIAGDLRNDLHRAAERAGIGGQPRPYEIHVYRGFGNGERVLIHGRVLEETEVEAAAATDSAWKNLINVYRRIESDPVPRAQVRIRIAGVEQDLVADNEGFFRAWIELRAPFASHEPWQRVEVKLIAPLRPDQPDVRANGVVRVPSTSSSFGVISDLDDTVIQSRVSNFMQAIRTVMLGNARTRLPFPGVAAFYQALERGGDGARQNPIFYVSSSPWNIHDIIAEFMSVQQIPTGPICLRDWDFDVAALTGHRHRTHKEPLIREILDLYPSLPFILIGDSSQRDPEIYREIIDRYPGRILAIYIRNVDPDPERLASIRALENDVLAAGSALVLADDTYSAAVHAAEHGWIAADALPAVKEEKRADEGTSGAKRDVPGTDENPRGPTIIVE